MPDPPNSDPLQRVGARIRHLREQAGLSLEDVAWVVRISKAHLSRVERGERTPSLDLLLSLARRLDVLVADLVAVDDDPRSEMMRASLGADMSLVRRVTRVLARSR